MVGDDDGEVPPVPIPNTEVKTLVPKIVRWKRRVKIGSRRLEYAALRVLRAVFVVSADCDFYLKLL